MIQALLELGSDVDEVESEFKTPLHLAAEFCHPEAVQQLLSAKAKVEAVTSKHETALHLTVKRESKDFDFRTNVDRKKVIEVCSTTD